MGNSKEGGLREIKGNIVAYRVVKAEEVEEQHSDVIITDVKLPSDAPARMKTLKAEGKKWYLTVVYHPDTERPFALFCTTNNREKGVPVSNALDKLLGLAESAGILEKHIFQLKEKTETENNVNKLTRTISLLLRHNVSMVRIVNTLDEVEDVYVGSFLFQIKKFLSAYIKDGEEVEGGKCEECGGAHLIYSEGCMVCGECGSSKCG